MYTNQPVWKRVNLAGEMWVEVAEALAGGMPLEQIDNYQQCTFEGKVGKYIRCRDVAKYLMDRGDIEGTLEGEPVPFDPFFQAAAEAHGAKQLP